MTLQAITEELTRFITEHSNNVIQSSYALDSGLVGMHFFEAPLLGCAAADDPLFLRFQTDPVIIGPMFRLPEQWLPGAKSVISFFLPFTKEIRDSNVEPLEEPSTAWLHGRKEGQEFMMEACEQVARWLREGGYEAVIPAGHPDFLHAQALYQGSQHSPQAESQRSEAAETERADGAFRTDAGIHRR